MAKNSKDDPKTAKAAAKAERQTKQQKRKNAQVANRNKQKNTEGKKRGGLREYFKGVRVETKKVVWPTKKELMSYTFVVIFTCAVLGLAIWGIDTGFLALLKALFNISL